MIIMGIDPGSAICGYGFVEYRRGILYPISFGVIYTSHSALLQDRLLKIHSHLSSLINLFRPQVMGLETLFFGKNSTSAIPVAQARGVVLLNAALNALHVIEISPNEVKQSITGYGAANKQQVIYMVSKLLKLAEPPSPDDAADALAIAVAAAHSLHDFSSGG